jgi:hypothetical protein
MKRGEGEGVEMAALHLSPTRGWYGAQTTHLLQGSIQMDGTCSLV